MAQHLQRAGKAEARREWTLSQGRKIRSKTEELELMRHNAKAWARERGHDLGRWATVPRKVRQWKAGCRRCGSDLFVTLDEHNNPMYSGEVSKGKCPEIHG